MQLLAMLTMLIDHIGIVWFPGETVWRMIGRIAFPLYAFALAIGYQRTRSVPRYMARLAVIAALSQLPYQLAFHKFELNVVGTLLVGLFTLAALDRLKGRRLLQGCAIAAAAALLELLPFSYGAYALALVLIYRYARASRMTPLHLAVNIAAVFYNGIGWYLQLFSLFATLLLVYAPQLLRGLDRIAVPRFVWRSFYPLHLALIGVAALLEASGFFSGLE